MDKQPMANFRASLANVKALVDEIVAVAEMMREPRVREAAALLRVSTWTIDRARKEELLAEVERIGARYVRITGESLVS